MINPDKSDLKIRVITLAIKDIVALQSSHSSFLKSGGLFVPTSRQFKLGEELYLLLHLMGEPEKLPFLGEIIWITPEGPEDNRAPGIGVQFKEEEAKLIQSKIEAHL